MTEKGLGGTGYLEFIIALGEDDIQAESAVLRHGTSHPQPPKNAQGAATHRALLQASAWRYCLSGTVTGQLARGFGHYICSQESGQ